MNDIIIIAPVLNEKANIKILFNKLIATNIAFDLLFIDDNSSDGSKELIKDLVKKNQNVIFIFTGGGPAVFAYNEEIATIK